MTKADDTMAEKGKVYLIGAGPGDPDLITARGIACLKEADVVVYDYLVSEAILAHAPDNVRRIYVGKKGGHASIAQDAINNILLSAYQDGAVVARLKGGDPFVFGRGGEEACFLAEKGVAFEVVPGVTSAIAVPAYAGIPLTHRDCTSTVAFVTGHEDPLKDTSAVDWDALARIGTLVFLMGIRNLAAIVGHLTAAGKNDTTPAAIIRWGTTSRQETVTGTLADIVDRAAEHGIVPPAIFVVGDVVSFRDRLAWYEQKPLFGKTILVTRPAGQEGDLTAMLHAQGADVVPVPLIEIVPPVDFGDMDRAITAVDDYDWIIFTSVNGVQYFFDRLRAVGKDARALAGVRIAAIGPATAAALEAHGISADAMPESYVSEAMVDLFSGMAMTGKRILLPRAAEARDVIPRGLTAMGARVDVVEAYQSIPSKGVKEKVTELFAGNAVDVVTFMSPSAVRVFSRAVDGENLPAGVMCAAIGPVTAAALEEAGLRCDVTAETYTARGLTDAIVRGIALTGKS